MLGFDIVIHKLQNGNEPASTLKAPTAGRLIHWFGGISGTDWLDALVKNGAANCLGGNGYPIAYTAKLRNVIPEIRSVSPESIATWMDPVLIDRETGKQTFDPGPLSRCSLDEWVLINAWDAS